MSAISGASSRPQRSSSTTRSRRATLSVGQHGGSLLGNGSLSPQRAMRTRVLRERSNDGGGGVQHSSSDVVGAAGTVKELAKVASKGATKAQQMQFAFGSKVTKPSSSGKGGMTSAAGVPTRGRASGIGAVVADAGNAPARSRRERTVRHEPQEQQQRASSHGRGRARAEHQHQHHQSTIPTREQAENAALKVRLEEQEAMVANLKRQLAKEHPEGEDGVSGGKSAAAPATRAASGGTLKVDGGDAAKRGQQQLDEVDEGEQAALRAVEEEARGEAEAKLAKAEAMAAAGLSHLSEMQARVDEMIRVLKAQRE
ncbi:unnamed protein product [Pylaiella littoralis]